MRVGADATERGDGLRKRQLRHRLGDVAESRPGDQTGVGETWRGVLCLLGGQDGVVKIGLTAW